jgi:hypothetical protein
LGVVFISAQGRERPGIPDALEDLHRQERILERPVEADGAMRGRGELIRAVALMITRRLDNIITPCFHQPTNAVAKGLISKIMAITRRPGATGTS